VEAEQRADEAEDKVRHSIFLQKSKRRQRSNILGELVCLCLRYSVPYKSVAEAGRGSFLSA